MTLILDLFPDDFDVKDKHPKCLGTYDEWNGDYGCGYYSTLDCSDCKYGMGRKDPDAKCNQG